VGIRELRMENREWEKSGESGKGKDQTKEQDEDEVKSGVIANRKPREAICNWKP
jgi:hypothetical protein